MDTPHPDFQLRRILDSAPALIHTGLPDGYLDFFNQTWLTYVGRSLEDLQGWKWTASIHPDDLDAMLQAWRTALASGEPFLHEARVRRADGEYHWMLHHRIALRDEHGNIVRWFGSCIDIEDRKRAEEALRENEQRFRTLVDHATDAFGLVDERGIIVDVNREACESRGYRREEMIGMSVSEIDPDVDLDAIQKRFAAGEQVVTFESRNRRKDGTLFPVEVRTRRFVSPDGRVFSLTLGRDITERKRADEKVRQQERTLREILDLVPHQIVVFAADGTPLYSNQVSLDYYAMTIEELRESVTDPRRTFRRFAHPEDGETFVAAWERGFAGTAPWETEVRFRRGDGEYRWFLVRSIPLRDDEGRIIRWYNTATDIDDRKKAEEALRESEEHYRALIEVSPQIVWTMSSDGFNMQTNQWWYEYTGLTRPETEGLDPVHPEHRRQLWKSWRQAVAAGGEWTAEAPFRRAADGQYRWHLLRGRPMRDADGQIVRWMGIAVDIHDRREAEEALRESEARYRALIEVSPQMIWMAQADGSNIYFNQWWYDYTGLTRAETEGFGWAQAVHPEHRDRTIEMWREHMASGTEFSNEATLRRAADGQYRWHLARGLPIRDADGGIVRWIGIAIDIHDRREAEESLRRTEAWLSEAQRLSHTGSWARNLATEEMVYVSDELLRIAGLDRGLGNSLAWSDEGTMLTTPGGMSGPLFGRVHPEDQLKAVEETERAIRDKTDAAGERRVLLPDGTVRHIQYVLHPVFDAAGHPVELIGTVMDVTERKQAEEALRETQAALTRVTRVSTVGEVSASIAHELNQPLGAISNNANACLSLLSGTAPDLDEVRGALADIVGDAERASAIIERVRGLARRSAPERIPVRLADLVRDVAALVAADAANRRVAIRIDVPQDLPLILGDRVELHQVLLNLVVNGMDAMSGVEQSHRRLEIRGVPDELDGHPAARISVEDRGVGLSREHADQLFEPFYTTKAHGMGLGLAISRSIIEAHGGRLWAEANPGPGATFSFALPAAAAA